MYQAVEPIPEDTDALLFRPVEVPNKEVLWYRRLAVGLLVSGVLVACILGLTSYHSKTRVHVKGLKGSTVTSLVAKKDAPHVTTKRTHMLDGAKDGDDDVCQTAEAITNWNSFDTQTECDSCCSDTCSDYISSDDAYLWLCESSATAPSCSYSYETFTIYKTSLCWACCETDCTRYIGGDTYTYYFCS